MLRKLFLSFMIFMTCLSFLSGIGELYLRAKHPFNEIIWDQRFDPKYGFTFVPGSRVRYTNHVEFWIQDHANSFGFLDREVPLRLPTGSCRVVFIGDSFVEGAQVKRDERIAAVFEEIAREQLPDLQIYSNGFGYSGTGQSNQLAFYDTFIQSLRPSIVVLVFVRNDFKNNSSLLEAVVNGWHPEYPPRLFFDPVTFDPIPISSNWMGDGIPLPLPTLPPITDWLNRHSYAYTWLDSTILGRTPMMSKITGKKTYAELEKERLDWLKQNGYLNAFGDWDPLQTDEDQMFLLEDLPPAFEDALRLTEHSLDEFIRRSQQDNFRLVILLSSQVTEMQSTGTNLYRDRIVNMAAERAISLIDQWQYIVSVGETPEKAHFITDSHWNAQGHRWAAESVLSYFETHQEICASQ